MIPDVKVPCRVCGAVSERPLCPEHEEATAPRGRASYRDRGYDGAWDRLSRRARARQNFCTLCSATENLSTDHSPEAWHRKAHGLPIRLRDVQVLCAGCQAKLGSSRPGSRRYTAWLESRADRPGGHRGYLTWRAEP